MTPKRPSPIEMAEVAANRYTTNTPYPPECTDWNKKFSATTYASGYVDGHEAAMKEAEILVEALEKIESLDLADGYAARDALARYRGGQS